jgi:CheY-like chemotaxis protein/Tfp pilus assembly protein PilZ
MVAEKRGPGKRILLVDDSPFYLARLKDLLSTMAYQAVLASRAREGQEILLREHGTIDLLIIDLKMPEVDGFAFLRWLRAQSWGKEFRVLVLTGAYELSEIVKPLRELGVIGLVDKGSNPHHILSRINSALCPDAVQMRRHERVTCDLPVSFTYGAMQKRATLTHLSLGGCFIITPEELPIEATIEIQVEIPGASRIHHLKGRVVWRMGGEGWTLARTSSKGVGVQWRDPTGAAVSDLGCYIAQRREEDKLLDLIGP